MPKLGFLVILAVLFLAVSAFAVQDTAAGPARKPAGQGTKTGAARRSQGSRTATTAKKSSPEEDMAKFQQLMPDFIALLSKLQNIQLPPPRTQSRLLPLLPASTQFFFSAPNLNEQLQQAREIFNQQLQESPVLRDWWQGVQQDMQKNTKDKGPSLDAVLDKLHEIFGYLGDEVVFGMSLDDKDPVKKDASILLIAQVKKPGLRQAIEKAAGDLGAKPGSLRIYSAEELMAVKEENTGGKHLSEEPALLVRPDFVAFGVSMASLQRLNAGLDSGGGRFDTSAFGQRLQQAYQGGAGFLGGMDLGYIINSIQKTDEKDVAMLRQTGFDDAKYMVGEARQTGGQILSHYELSFNGQRRGIASWLAAPGKMGGLDFLPPDAVMAGSILLKNPAAIYDDIKALAEANKPGSTQNWDQMQTAFNLNLRDDLLGKLAGEITYAVQDPTGADPGWTVALKTTEPNGLQKTFERLVAFMGMTAGEGKGPTLASESENGHTYYTVTIPGGLKSMEISYTNVGGYTVIAPGKQKVMEAVRLHDSGRSLAKIGDMKGMLPADMNSFSAVFYQSKSPFLAAMLQMSGMSSPQLQAQLGDAPPAPTAGWARADEKAIQFGSNSRGIDVTGLLIGAAIAIPNIIKTKANAGEAAAASTVRTLNTSQITYATTYKNRGYAPNLATLGPPPGSDCSSGGATAAHACLLNATLGCSTGPWCEMNGYRYKVSAPGATLKRDEYVVVATPASSESGTKSYCSTSDAVVRFKEGPVTGPITAAQCRQWQPL